MSEYKRLTKHHVHFDGSHGYELLGFGAIEQRPFFNAIKRLAQYEDTGSPEEFAELAKAREEGRLVVLPFSETDRIILGEYSKLTKEEAEKGLQRKGEER